MKRTPEEILERMDAILDEYETADDNFKRGQWSDKFGERFGQYSDKLKQLNGDDFDILKESYDEYNKDYSDLSDDEYADSLEENIKRVLARIWPNEPEKVEQAVEEAVNATEGESEETNPAEEPSDGTLTVTEISKDVDTPEGEEETPSEDKETPSESEEDKFVRELEEYKANLPKRK